MGKLSLHGSSSCLEVIMKLNMAILPLLIATLCLDLHGTRAALRSLWSLLSVVLAGPAYAFFVLNSIIVTILARSKLEHRGGRGEGNAFRGGGGGRPCSANGSSAPARHGNSPSGDVNVKDGSSPTGGHGNSSSGDGGNACGGDKRQGEVVVAQQGEAGEGTPSYGERANEGGVGTPCYGGLDKGGGHAWPQQKGGGGGGERTEIGRRDSEECAEGGEAKGDAEEAPSQGGLSMEETWAAISTRGRTPNGTTPLEEEATHGALSLEKAAGAAVLSRWDGLRESESEKRSWCYDGGGKATIRAQGGDGDAGSRAESAPSRSEDILRRRRLARAAMSVEELKQRSEDFIARFNRQMRLQREHSLHRRIRTCNNMHAHAHPRTAFVVLTM